MADPDRITQLLHRASAGDEEASEQLLPLLYQELRSLARRRMGQLAPGQTLQPTALVHEAYLRISQKQGQEWEGRRHYFFAAARAMHDILVETARRKASLKRGGDQQRVEFPSEGLALEAPTDDMLSLAEALERLRAQDPEGHELVMLRYFSALTVPEVADTLGVSVSTVERKWRFLKAWLAGQLDAQTPEA